MAESNKSAIAAVFAAGLAAGGGGAGVVQNEQIEAANARADAAVAIVDQLDTHMPTIKTYISNAVDASIGAVLEDRIQVPFASQMVQLADDIEADIAQGENVPLRDLAGALAGKVRLDDPLWLSWYDQHFAVYLRSQIETGVAVGNLSYDQLVRLADVTESMRATANLHIPPIPVEAEQSTIHAQETLKEAGEQKGEILRERGLIE